MGQTVSKLGVNFSLPPVAGPHLENHIPITGKINHTFSHRSVQHVIFCLEWYHVFLLDQKKKSLMTKADALPERGLTLGGWRLWFGTCLFFAFFSVWGSGAKVFVQWVKSTKYYSIYDYCNLKCLCCLCDILTRGLCSCTDVAVTLARCTEAVASVWIHFLLD